MNFAVQVLRLTDYLEILTRNMFILKKINQLNRLPLRYGIRMLLFQLKKTLGLTYTDSDYQLNTFLTTHLLRFNGSLKNEEINTYTSDFYFDENNKCGITLRKPPSSDFAVFEQVFLLKEYEPLIKLIKTEESRIKRAMNIIDAGGNIGLTSIFFNKHFPFSKFGIIEPDIENLKILERNIRQNNFASCAVIPGGLWNKDCYLKTGRDFRDGNDWSVSVEESETATGLKGFSISSLMKLLDFDCIDILKIDIEGSEKHLFKDDVAASEFLLKTKYLAIEIHDEMNCREHINALLTVNNFEFFFQDGLTIGVNRKLVN